MSPNLNDIGTTAIGGSAGMLMLNSLTWSQVYGGESTKLVVALLLIVGSYFAYRNVPKPPDPPTSPEPK